jgi:hypothetical protein
VGGHVCCSHGGHPLQVMALHGCAAAAARWSDKVFLGTWASASALVRGIWQNHRSCLDLWLGDCLSLWQATLP